MSLVPLVERVIPSLQAGLDDVPGKHNETRKSGAGDLIHFVQCHDALTMQNCEGFMAEALDSHPMTIPPCRALDNEVQEWPLQFLRVQEAGWGMFNDQCLMVGMGAGLARRHGE